MTDASPVGLAVVFERFPASVRGAIVVRGLDADPHQVTVDRATVTVAAAPSREVAPVAIEPAIVDVAPRGEVLVPFDVPFAALPPGWYRVVPEGDVDGQQRVRGPDAGKRFLVPWPAEEVRRGEITVDRTIDVPGIGGVVVERIECRADRAVVRWSHPRPGEGAPALGELRVLAGRNHLPVMEGTGDPSTGERTTIIYPVLKRHRSLTFELQGPEPQRKRQRRGRWSSSINLP